MKKLTNEEFISKSNIRHNSKYDYSLSEYISSSSKVKIICREHGIFEQTANSHMQGVGCSKCSGNEKSNIFDFIKKSNIRHNNRYDYSLSEYKNATTKVKIICKEHGVFEQTPNTHLGGIGCKKCGYIDVAMKNSIGDNEFKSICKEIHNNKYNYSLVKYSSNKKSIKIICPIHGEFEQLPYVHMKGGGCRICGINESVLKRTKTKDQFVEDAYKVHQNMYDYSLVEYKGTDVKVKIICKEHGGFEQKPFKHLSGQGCPICSESRLEKEVRLFLTNNNIDFRQQYGKKEDSFHLNGQLLDFYLPGYGLAIECQGDQHFRPVDFGNKGEEYSNNSFRLNLSRDINKYSLCSSIGVEIIYYCKEYNIQGIDNYIGDLYSDLNKLLEKIKNKNRNE